jgi:hypothetical protein
MKSLTIKLVALLAILILPGEALGAGTERGLILYDQPPATYVVALEFVTIRTTSVAFVTVTLPDGRKQELPRSGIVAAIDYPPEIPAESFAKDAATATQNIRTLSAKYPQCAAKLNAALNKWTNALAFYQQTQKLGPALPSLKTSNGTTLDVEGVKYSEPILSSFDGNTVTISHSAGILRLPIEKLKPDQIRFLNSTSKTVRIVNKDEAIGRLQTLAANPESFVALLAKDSRRFPLTAFCFELRNKDWTSAEAMATGASGIIHGRLMQIGKEVGESPLIYVVAAQAESNDIPGAFKTCEAISSIGERTLAHRILTEWCLKLGNLDRAIAACVSTTADLNKLPNLERMKLNGPSQSGELSDETMSAIVQQGIAHRLLCKGLVDGGRLGKAEYHCNRKWIKDRHEFVRALSSTISGDIIANPAIGDAFASGVIPSYKNVMDQSELLRAKANGHAGLKDWDGAIKALLEAVDLTKRPDPTIPAEALVESRISIMVRLAQVYRSAGRAAEVEQMIADALDLAEGARSYRSSL